MAAKVFIPDDSEQIIEWVNSNSKYYKGDILLSKFIFDDEPFVYSEYSVIYSWLRLNNVNVSYSNSMYFKMHDFDDTFILYDDRELLHDEIEPYLDKFYDIAKSKGYKFAIKPHHVVNDGVSGYFCLDYNEMMKYYMIDKDEDNVYFKNYEEGLMESMKKDRVLIRLDT